MKLHPLSVPVRAVSRLQLRGLVVPVGAALASQGSLGASGAVVTGLVILAVILAVRLVREALYYQRFEYLLTDDTLDIASGVVSRRERTIPIRRIQNVDIAEDLLARLVGLAAVSFETAGGGNDAEGEIRYVTNHEAKRLQNEIQRLKRVRTGDGADGSGTPESTTETGTAVGEPSPADDELFSLSMGNLLLTSVLSLDLRPLIPVAVVVFEGVRYVPGGVADAVIGHPGVGAIVVAVGSVVASAGMTFVRYYDFRLWRADDELRYERGLVSRYTGSIPFEKIQNLIVNENALERWFGYASLDAETAGYGSSTAASRGSESVVPIAEREAVLRFARSIDGFDFDDLDFSRPPKRARRRYAGRYAIALVTVTAGLFVAHRLLDFGPFRWWFAPLVLVLGVPFAAHYKWLHRGVRATEAFVLTRNGFWGRSIQIVPYYRVQTVIAERTVFQRRWRLATVVVDTAGSRNLRHHGARAVDFGGREADELRETVRRRLRRSVIQRRTERVSVPSGRTR